ncbi:MAG: hypothetical protein A3I14_06680 [Candidatus Rokubacteria bacterium RIFCSPLOWO2_02_FULL_73_56]|nr:MAG: hypothetical protein A3I14_06680 [Candidatus Rokubacteria bacterium RIFCSPLOWO2_02_FULL_73_56]OGL30150.1 MAG: hypothetical protein A3G44_00695 [Candidatus Rokubacteria bacterium RIFCSPLOWO2_12_FULL_73_47]
MTAVEPAPAMAAALRRAAAREGLRNLTVHEAPWGEVEVGPHDLVVCAHVSHLLTPGSPFLGAAAALARRGVVLVRDLPGGPDKFFFGELYPILLGRPYVHGCDARDTVGELERLGIAPTLTPIEYGSDQPFDSLDEACEFWIEYMRLADAGARDFLRAFLAERLTREGDGWVAPFRKRAMVVHWRTRGAGGQDG